MRNIPLMLYVNLHYKSTVYDAYSAVPVSVAVNVLCNCSCLSHAGQSMYAGRLDQIRIDRLAALSMLLPCRIFFHQ